MLRNIQKDSNLTHALRSDQREDQDTTHGAQMNRRAGGSVWYERRLRKAEVAGSNPARSTPKQEL